MFIKCHDVTHALLIFNRRDEPMKTLELFKRMKDENIEANEMIFVLILDACAHIEHLSLAQSIVSQIPEHFSLNRWINNASIDMWVK
jgi:hypothetical protein